MSEFSECLDLTGKALPAGWREPRVRQEFDRHQIAGVRALSEPDHAHPALAEYFLQPVRAEFPKRHRFEGCADQTIGNVRQAAIQ